METLTKKELTAIVTEASGAAVKAELAKFAVEPKQHFLDHELVSGVREGIKTSRKGAFYTLGLASVGGVVYAFKVWIFKLVGKGGP